MRVVCRTVDPEQFEVSSRRLQYFRKFFGRGAEPTFSSVTPGREYVVYAIEFRPSGVPFFFVSRRGRRDDWFFVPYLCFDVVDAAASKLWHLGIRGIGGNDSDDVLATLAIRDWIEEPLFFEHLVGRRQREVDIMIAAAAAMDAEHE